MRLNLDDSLSISLFPRKESDYPLKSILHLERKAFTGKSFTRLWINVFQDYVASDSLKLFGASLMVPLNHRIFHLEWPGVVDLTKEWHGYESRWWILRYWEDEKKTRDKEQERKRVARTIARRLSPPSNHFFMQLRETSHSCVAINAQVFAHVLTYAYKKYEIVRICTGFNRKAFALWFKYFDHLPRWNFSI